jgi:hypothetical protein
MEHQCTICSNLLTVRNQIHLECCLEAIHTACLLEWTQVGEHITCPFCRSELSDDYLELLDVQFDRLDQFANEPFALKTVNLQQVAVNDLDLHGVGCYWRPITAIGQEMIIIRLENCQYQYNRDRNQLEVDLQGSNYQALLSILNQIRMIHNQNMESDFQLDLPANSEDHHLIQIIEESYQSQCIGLSLRGIASFEFIIELIDDGSENIIIHYLLNAVKCVLKMDLIKDNYVDLTNSDEDISLQSDEDDSMEYQSSSSESDSNSEIMEDLEAECQDLQNDNFMYGIPDCKLSNESTYGSF